MPTRERKTNATFKNKTKIIELMEFVEMLELITGEQLRAIKQVLSLSDSQRDPFRRYTILTMQLADVGECIEYMKAYPSLVDGYKAELKVALSDLLVQTITMIVLYGLDPKEILDLGIKRLEEFRKKGPFVE